MTGCTENVAETDFSRIPSLRRSTGSIPVAILVCPCLPKYPIQYFLAKA